MEMAKIGATGKGGVNRIAFSDLDAEARNLFRTWAEDAGCTVRTDRFGNMFARRRRSNPNAPLDPAAVPSDLFELIHLDMIARGQFYARRGMISMSLPTTDDDLVEFSAALASTLEMRAPLIQEAFDRMAP